MLTRAGCERRQQRLLAELAASDRTHFITTNYRTVYYLTGNLVAAETPVAFALMSDGSSLLVTPNKADALATTVIPFDTYAIDRVIDHPWRDAAQIFNDTIGNTDRPAVEKSGTNAFFNRSAATDATDLILKLRKRKESDEVDEIRESLGLIAAAYDAARATIAPDLTENDVFLAMQSAVVHAAGEFVHLNGDFAVGERAIRGGGPSTERKLQPGDLYILDLFPAPHLYFGDTCRTFAVTKPTTAQLDAHRRVVDAMATGESMIRPGVAARDVYQRVKDMLGESFWHHAGHGIGHHGHEAPRIIPGSEDVFEEGDVITLEPGIYGPELGGGIRIEDNYLVTATGIENLFHYPKEL